MIIGLEEFVNGDPTQIYSRMRADQRTAIANEFERALRVAGDPAARQFEEEWNRNEEVPRTLSVAQVAAIAAYTRQHHPQLVEQIAQHPVTQSVLANASAPAAEETAAEAAAAAATAADGQAEQALQALAAEQVNAAGSPAFTAPDLLESAAETEATPAPEAAPNAPADQIINPGDLPEAAPSPVPEPSYETSAEVAADELRAHDVTNEEIAGENPGAEL